MNAKQILEDINSLQKCGIDMPTLRVRVFAETDGSVVHASADGCRFASLNKTEESLVDLDECARMEQAERLCSNCSVDFRVYSGDLSGASGTVYDARHLASDILSLIRLDITVSKYVNPARDFVEARDLQFVASSLLEHYPPFAHLGTMAKELHERVQRRIFAAARDSEKLSRGFQELAQKCANEYLFYEAISNSSLSSKTLELIKAAPKEDVETILLESTEMVLGPYPSVASASYSFKDENLLPLIATLGEEGFREVPLLVHLALMVREFRIRASRDFIVVDQPVPPEVLETFKVFASERATEVSVLECYQAALVV